MTLGLRLPRDVTIRARWIVPIHGPPLEGGRLRIVAGRIAGLGRGPRRHGDLDLPDAIVIPGLVNAHTHLEFSDVEAPLEAADGLPGWIGRVIDMRRSRRAGAAGDAWVADAVRRGVEESACHGVTAIGEISTRTPAGGYLPRGPRLRVFREALGLASPAAAGIARDTVRDLDRLQAAGLAAGISPHAPYSVSAALAARLLAATRRRVLPLAMHVAESEAESELLRGGTGPFRDLFARVGVWPAGGPALLTAADWITLLARGPRAIVVHGTFLDRDDTAFARLVRHRDRLAVAVCPRTTAMMSGRLPPVGLFRRAGVRVAIGTDSRASSPDLSVLAECRTLADAGHASPADALRMATIDAAWALGFERCCGILAPGRPADLAVLAPPPSARGNPFDTILDPATRVVATLRGGRLIAGRMPDEAEARAAAP